MKKIYISFYIIIISKFAFSQWDTVNTGKSNSLYSEYFTDNNIGYVSGMPACIYKTTNGRNVGNNISVMIGFHWYSLQKYSSRTAALNKRSL